MIIRMDGEDTECRLDIHSSKQCTSTSLNYEISNMVKILVRHCCKIRQNEVIYRASLQGR